MISINEDENEDRDMDKPVDNNRTIEATRVL
jgi:hypothetical protein